MTAQTLRDTYLRGLPLADEFGRPMPDNLLEIKVRAVVAAFQRRYAVRLSPTLVRLGSAALPGEPFAPDLPTYETDAINYDPRDFEGDRYASLKLPIGPVKKVLSVCLLLPGARPMPWPETWIQVSPKAKTVQIYPMGATLNWAPFQTSGLGMSALASNRLIPNAWQVAYLAGYTDDDLAGDAADVAQAIGMLSAISVLIPGSMDRFASQGIAGLSASVDGLSNSTNLAGGGQNLRYAPLIEGYKAELESWEKMYRARSSLRWTVL